MACEIKELLAPNGKPSKLYQDLLNFTGSQTEALTFYLSTQTDKFKSWFGNSLDSEFIDSNGEPKLKNGVIYNNLGESYELYPKEEIVEEVIEEEEEISTSDLTDNTKDFEQLIDRQEDLVKVLKGRLTQRGVNREAIKNRIERVEATIDNLIDKNTNKAVLEAANQTIEEIENIFANIETDLEGDISSKQGLKILDTLHYNNIFLSAWGDLRDFVQYEGERKQDLFILEGKLADLQNRYLELGKEAFLKIARQVSYNPSLTKEKLFGSIEDTNLGVLYTMGTAASNSDLVKVTDDLIKQAKFKANQEYIELKKLIESKSDKVLKHLRVKNFNETDVFLQLDKNGNFTGNYIGPYKYEYYQNKIKFIEEAKKNPKLWSKYFKFVRENSNFITQEEVNSGKSQHFSEEELELQKELLEEYEDDLEQVKIALQDMGLTEEQQVKEVQNWEYHHSPYITMNDVVTKKVRSKYRKFAFKYTLREKPSKKWEDNRFNKIKNDEVLLDYWNFMTNTIKNNNKNLPYLNVGGHYLPEMDKAFWERLRQSKGSVKDLVLDELISAVSQETEDIIDTRVNIAGKTFKNIPVRMMANKLNPEEKSRNIAEILLTHSAMSTQYKYKSQIEPLAQASLDFIDSMDRIETIEGGTAKMTLNGRTKDMGKTLHNTRNHLEHAINAYFYDERRGEKKGRISTIKTSKQKKEIAALEAKLKSGELTDKEFTAAKMKLSRQITSSTITDNMIKLTYLKALSLPNVVSPAVNMLYGIASNFIYAAPGIDVDSNSVYKASKIMLSATFKNIGNKINPGVTDKVYAWMETLDVLGEVNESNYGSKKTVLDKATILQQKAEYFNQGSLMLAYLIKNKIKDASGKSVPIWEAYTVKDGKLTWDTNKMGKQTKVPENKLFAEDGRGINLYRLSRKIAGMNKPIHGDYESDLYMKKSDLGRIISLFKTWLPAAVAYRFGRERFDPELGKTIKGRYKSYLKVEEIDGTEVKGAMKIMRKYLLNSLVRGKKAYSHLSEVDKVNLMRNVRELHFMASTVLLAALLKGLADEEEDNTFSKSALFLLTNALSKTNADLSFFLNPSSSAQIMDNLISIYGTAKDITNLIPATIDTITGEAYYKGGTMKDQLKLPISILRNIPGSSGAIRMWNSTKRAWEYN